ncbi:MAG: hypothetical protein WCV00_20745 [Verrucomicrobiia bacterium]|jgi:hypothetical protein
MNQLVGGAGILIVAGRCLAPAVGAEGGEAEVVLLPVFTSVGIVRFDVADGKRFSFLVRRVRRGVGWVPDPAASLSMSAAWGHASYRIRVNPCQFAADNPALGRRTRVGGLPQQMALFFGNNR